MLPKISALAQVHPDAQLGRGTEIGPFCIIGPEVKLGDGCVLESHIVLSGRVEIGNHNRLSAHCYLGADPIGPITSQLDSLTKLGNGNVLFPRVSVVGNSVIGDRNQLFDNVVIGRAPQDASYKGAPTGVLVGHDNVFREHVTIHRGAEKEDGMTRVGNHNVLMENAHIGHNSQVHDFVTLANNVAVGGHAQIHDRAVIGGNCGVHQFSTVGTLAMVGGVSRVTSDAPPYMMFTGNDQPRVVMVNIVGLRRSGVSESTIDLLRHAYKLIWRKHLPLVEVRQEFGEQLDGIIPLELANLLNAVEAQNNGANGRAREAIRDTPAFHYQQPEPQRKAA